MYISLVMLALIGCSYRYKKNSEAKRSQKRLKFYEYYSLLISHYNVVGFLVDSFVSGAVVLDYEREPVV